MAPITIEPNQIIRQTLIATGTELYTQIGTKAAVLRKQTGWATTDKCVVFAIRGGNTDPDMPVMRVSVQFLCYGGDTLVESATTVYRALVDRLNGANRIGVAAGIMLSAVEEVAGQPLVDPDTKEVYVFCAYEMELRGAT